MQRVVGGAPERLLFRPSPSRANCPVTGGRSCWADAFYEWKVVEGGKQPYAIARQDDRPMAFAGLWESLRWSDETVTPGARGASPSGGRTNLVILGLSLSSSWGDGHATTYRALLRGLGARGHGVLFLERDMPWYASARHAAAIPPSCQRTSARASPRSMLSSSDPMCRMALRSWASWPPPRRRARVLRHQYADHRRDAGTRRLQLPGCLAGVDVDLYLSFTGGPLSTLL